MRDSNGLRPSTPSPGADALARRLAMEIMRAALKASDPYEAVRRALRLEGNVLKVFGREFHIKGKVYVIAFGKAACPMAKAVEDVLGDLIAEGVAVTKYGYGEELRRIKVVEAGHPVPDRNSMLGAVEGVRIARKAGPDDIVIVLISGGGSALFVMPEDGISLEDKVRTNELLLKCGAKIYEINTVRKHISKVKGGKLAKIVRGTLVGLILSDVVGDPLEAIASGPTVKDPTTFADALRVLKVYGVWGKVPESVRRHIELGLTGDVEETLKEDLPNVHNFIVGSGAIACENAAKRARELGLNPHILTTTLEGEAKDVGLAIASVIEEVWRRDRPFRKPAALIAGGETTVTILGEAGAGGPNQELALSASRKLKGLAGAALLAVDTDGTDGPTDAAGGLVDSTTASRLKDAGMDIEEVLRRHYAYEALKAAGALLVTGPTRTNVNSLVIAVVLGPKVSYGETPHTGPRSQTGGSLH